ncbi:MAG: peptidoglycan-associated lipoprotein Pal [Acidiferrobacterales bacterium]
MMMKSILNVALASVLTLLLAACGGSSAVKQDDTAGEGQSTTAGGAGSGAETGAAGGSGAGGQTLGAGGTRMAMAAERPDKMRVHFEFDSSAVDSEARRIIEAHAAYLAANPDIKITLEGHADERGTREYNLALGERRGNSVERMIRVLGISDDRLNIISFGEERPLAMGHGESSWRLNRRVEFLYLN